MTTDPTAGGELTDDALQREIELVGELVVAASASDGPLTEEQIDLILGIERRHRDSRVSPPGTRELRPQQA